MRFVLIDETIVSYGFWVNVAGIDLAQFKKNPVMYWMHQRPNKWDGDKQVLPIGRWKDIKRETINGINAITAEPEFDEKDEFANKIKLKVEGGFIKMASAGLESITWSEEKKHLKPGQTRATLLKSLMREASIVDIGANKNALRLYEGGNLIDLSPDSENNIPIIKLKLNMKTIALKLGLNENASEDEILAKIEELNKSKKETEDLVDKLNAEKIENLLKSDAITDKNKSVFEKLAKTDFQLAEETLKQLSKVNEKKETIRLSDHLETTKLKSEKKEWKDFSQSELETLRDKDIATYTKLFEKEYGYVPVID